MFVDKRILLLITKRTHYSLLPRTQALQAWASFPPHFTWLRTFWWLCPESLHWLGGVDLCPAGHQQAEHPSTSICAKAIPTAGMAREHCESTATPPQELNTWTLLASLCHTVLEWFGLEGGPERSWTGTILIRPGCSKLRPTWPWTFPGWDKTSQSLESVKKCFHFIFLSQWVGRVIVHKCLLIAILIWACYMFISIQ